MRLVRAKSGLKQGELADHLGLNRQTIYQWESGRRFPDDKNFQKILDWAKADLDEESVSALTDALRDFPFREIKVLCQALNISRADLARTLGVNENMVSRWEEGESIEPGHWEQILTLRNAMVHGVSTVVDTINSQPQATRPADADRTSLQRMAPLPPSVARPARDARQRIRQAMDQLAQAQGDMLEAEGEAARGLALRVMAKVQRELIAAHDELDKLMEG